MWTPTLSLTHNEDNDTELIDYDLDTGVCRQREARSKKRCVEEGYHWLVSVFPFFSVVVSLALHT